MTTKNILFLLLFSIILPLKISEACGPHDTSFRGYSFLESKIVAQESEYAPYFLSFSDMYDYYNEVQEVKQRDNLEEWKNKVCQDASIEDIGAVIYKSTVLELEVLRTVIQSKEKKVGGKWVKNSFAKYLDAYQCTETIDYLIFAKKCEPHVVDGDAWGEDTHDYAAMQDLLHEGQKAFRKTNSDYIKLRYAYQIIRLAHYKQEYAKALDLHEYLMPKIDPVVVDDVRSLIYWWIVGHRAGALLQVGEKAEANYLFSRIFAQCPSKRESAFRSFNVKTQEEWEAVLKLCKSEKEQAVIYALRANATDSRAIQDMETIYKLNPKSKHLEVLLVKEIKELEQDLLGIEWNRNRKKNKSYHNIPRAMAGDYVIELQAFARQCRKKGAVNRPELWYIAEGYLELLAGDTYAAAQTFEEVRPLVQDENLQIQLSAFELALKIAAFDQVDESTERAAYDMVKDNDLFGIFKSFPRFLQDRMIHLYKKRGRPGKAFRAEYGLADLKTNPQNEIIDDLMTICQNGDRNPFERLLVEKEDNELVTNDLWDMKTTLWLQEYQLEAALLTMKEIPRTEWDNFGRFDPFRPTVKDCLSCPHSKDSIDLFNKGTLIEELLDLEYKAKAKPEEAPLAYFKIGTALYNMTYFGHSWAARDYYRSGANWNDLSGHKDGVFSIAGDGNPFGNKEVLNVEKPLYYFEKARLLTQNPELAAQAAFMAAKCEQAQYFKSEDFRAPSCYNCVPTLPPAYRTHYQMLVEQFSETAFYDKIIEECAYFKSYATK